MESERDRITKQREQWEQQVLKPALDRFKLDVSSTSFFTPADLEDFDFLIKVGFPGQYPFTAGTYAAYPYSPAPKRGVSVAAGLVRASTYSGYGTAEDTRDYYRQMQKLGQRSGPNLAFDLPTQCGYDADNPLVSGDVGKVGVSISTFRDFEMVYSAFEGEMNIDRVASNFTINAPANIILAMYCALAEKRGIALEKLRATPQNDILKEYIARGTFIFPPEPSVRRMFRDSVLFLTKHCPNINIASIGGYHIRGAGATRKQDLAFSMANGITYLETGVEAGLDIDSFAPRLTFNSFGGSVEFFQEIAFQRAARRMWGRILKERFKAKDPRSLLLRQAGSVHMGPENCTVQRPLNNLTRSVVGAIAAALSGGPPAPYPPFDEALGLGFSLEASQLSEDASRILQYEAGLTKVRDPLAGSYYVEHLTDEIEGEAWDELKKIDAMGGAIAAIDNGYLQREIAKSAYERQKRIEKGDDLVVGVNCYVGESEIDVSVARSVPHPYDPARREQAEETQIKNLAEVKKRRDSRAVAQSLKKLDSAARKHEENLVPQLIECVKAYATMQEMCDVLRGVFGEYQLKQL